MIKYAKIVDPEKGTCEVGIGTDDEFYQSIGMELMDVEQSENGTWYLAGKVPPPEITPADLTEFLYQEKCKIAYGGVTVVKGGAEYLFETNQDSITMCNSMALAMVSQPDNAVITWKVWQGDNPVMLTITKAEFNAIFAFGMTMINTAFGVEGALNEQAQSFTDEQLADVAFVQAFKATATEQLSQVNTVFNLEA